MHATAAAAAACDHIDTRARRRRRNRHTKTTRLMTPGGNGTRENLHAKCARISHVYLHKLSRIPPTNHQSHTMFVRMLTGGDGALATRIVTHERAALCPISWRGTDHAIGIWPARSRPIVTHVECDDYTRRVVVSWRARARHSTRYHTGRVRVVR